MQNKLYAQSVHNYSSNYLCSAKFILIFQEEKGPWIWKNRQSHSSSYKLVHFAQCFILEDWDVVREALPHF